MALDTWIIFFGAFCLIAISPGSGAILCMSHGLAYGVKCTSMTILGLELGLILIIMIAGAGVGSLLLASETAFNIIKILGALYLIYLGWSQWCTPIIARANTIDETSFVAIPTLTVSQRFMTGFLTNATNPKAIIFMIAMLPQFIDDSRPLWVQLFVMSITMIGIDILVMHGYAFMASAFQKILSNVRAITIQHRVFGGLLIAIGIGLFFV